MVPRRVSSQQDEADDELELYIHTSDNTAVQPHSQQT